MKRIILLIASVVLLASLAYSQSVANLEPQTVLPWAYALNDLGAEPIINDDELRTVPDSAQSFLLPATRDLYNPPDWHPEDHPLMPEIVAKGRSPTVFACSYCHLPAANYFSSLTPI